MLLNMHLQPYLVSYYVQKLVYPCVTVYCYQLIRLEFSKNAGKLC